MDLTKCQDASIHITKQSDAALNCIFSGRVKKDLDIVATWNELRAQLLADPSLAGMSLISVEKGGESVTLGLQDRRIQAALRFEAPPAPAKS